MHIFYQKEISSPECILQADEAQHCVKVLRLKQGDFIQLIDGQGGFYEGEILEPNLKKCLIRIVKKQEDFNKRAYKIHIAIAPTKNIERIEWFLEKVVEIGVDEISFLATTYAERKQINLERLSKIAVQAMKQSIKAYLPIIHPMSSFGNFIKTNPIQQKFIAHLGDYTSLQKTILPQQDICILIGPEGGFSEEEVNLAILHNFTPISLGTSKLRTETAGILACHTVFLANQF